MSFFKYIEKTNDINEIVANLTIGIHTFIYVSLVNIIPEKTILWNLEFRHWESKEQISCFICLRHIIKSMCIFLNIARKLFYVRFPLPLVVHILCPAAVLFALLLWAWLQAVLAPCFRWGIWWPCPWTTPALSSPKRSRNTSRLYRLASGMQTTTRYC